MTLFRTVLPSFAAVTLLLLLRPGGAAADYFSFEEVGQPTWSQTDAFSVNDAGVTAGTRHIGASGPLSFIYDGSAYTEILPPGWSDSTGYSISNTGQVVGDGTSPAGFRGYLYSGGTYTEIHPPGWTSSSPQDINDSGDIAGWGGSGGGITGFLYRGGTYTDIVPPGWSDMRISAINNSAMVVGGGKDGGGNYRGFLYDNGGYTTIHPPGWQSSSAGDINSSGQIVGNGTDSGGNVRGFFYENGSYTTIIPPGWSGAWVAALNDRGQAVGSAVFGGPNRSAFLYSGGVYHEIVPPPCGGQLFVRDINNSGKIAGYTYDGASAGTAYLISFPTLPDIKAGGRDGMVVLGPGDPLAVSISMFAGEGRGKPCDWWLFAQTPSGMVSFRVRSRSWEGGLFPSLQAGLRDVKPVKVFWEKTPGAGVYTFYFGVDTNRNGKLDGGDIYFDSVTAVVP